MILVGYSRAAEQYIDRILANPEWGYAVRGILDDHPPRGMEYKGVKVIGSIDNLLVILPQNQIDEIAITLGLDEYHKLEYIVNMCEKSGVHTKFIPDYNNIIPTKPYTEDIQNCNYSFFKNIAYYMYRQKYPREFRIAEFKAYPHPDIQKAINKTSAYSLLDNPTGIYVAQGQELVVLVADAHNEDMGICIQNLDKPGGDGFGGDTYPLTTGVNKIKVKNKGLVYVIYHTTSLEELAGICGLVFRKG